MVGLVQAEELQGAVLVGHNAFFDLNFLNAAVLRTQIKRNPFHPSTSFDTATLGGVAFGQTVLMRATLAVGLVLLWAQSAGNCEVVPSRSASQLVDAMRAALGASPTARLG